MTKREEPMFQVLGWIQVDPKEADKVMQSWGDTDIRTVAARLAFAKATELSPKMHDTDCHFVMKDTYSIRINVQDSNRDMLVSPDVIDDADIHVTAYWSDWSILFMGWQWAKILKKRAPQKQWGGKKEYYTQAGTSTRPMSDLMFQIKPEKMAALKQGELL